MTNSMFQMIGLTVLAFILGACAAKVAPNAASLQVDYTWTKSSKCTSVSPQISLSKVPKSTKELRVTLTDRDVLGYNHGGGVVKYTGGNVIPAGALKNYTGPCPPTGQHSYTIKVQAVDATGTIVGVGEKTSPCCP
jgi:phosphatidylethanolamine-binding protein (PEBP) family uncharacterized protein